MRRGRTPEARPGAGRALLHGSWDPALRAVIEELLVDERGLALERELTARPEVVLACVGGTDVAQTVALARAHATEARIVAVLPIRDERVAARALAAGACACYALDTPLAELHAILDRIVGPRARPSGQPVWRSS